MFGTKYFAYFCDVKSFKYTFMLKEILSISGKPGLFKLISQGKNMFLAESLTDKKRIPVYPRDKVVSLGDIAIYTDDEDIPLSVVLTNIKTKESEKQIQFSANIQPSELREYFKTVLPEFDEERVYPSDIKKIMNWYNLLISTGITDFEKKETEETAEGDAPAEEAEKVKAEPKAKAKAKTAAKTTTKAPEKSAAKTVTKAAPTKAYKRTKV